jgi:hypothetical protein
MKVLALVLSTVLATLLLVAGGLAIALATPHAHGWVFALGGFAIAPLIYGPVLLGSLLTYFDPARSKASRAAFTRWVVVVLGIEILAAAGIVVFAVVAHAPIWLPIVFIAVAAVLVVVAFAVANPLRRYDERRDHRAPAWSPVTHRQIIRKIAIIAITFAIAFVVSVAGLALLGSGAHGLRWGLVLAFALDFAFVASAFACIVAVLPLNRQLRTSLNRDLGTTRTFARVVMRGKKDDLTEDEQVPAARYAATMAVTLPFTLGYLTLLYAGIITQTLAMIAEHPSDPILGPWYVAILVGVLVVIYPLQITRTIRVRRYAREHAELLEAQPQPATAE